MEMFIIIVSFMAAFAGGLILLSSLASKRTQLIKAFNVQQEMETRDEPNELASTEATPSPQA